MRRLDAARLDSDEGCGELPAKGFQPFLRRCPLTLDLCELGFLTPDL
jgi:hypothetical protein